MRLSITYIKVGAAVDRMSSCHQKIITCLITLLILAGNQAGAINRVSVTTGNFTNPATWNPAGIPGSVDELTIQNGHVITVDNNSEAGQLTIATGGKLTFSPTRKLTVNSHFLVYGIAEIIDGDLSLPPDHHLP
jgi:G8 domain